MGNARVAAEASGAAAASGENEALPANPAPPATPPGLQQGAQVPAAAAEIAMPEVAAQVERRETSCL